MLKGHVRQAHQTYFYTQGNILQCTFKNVMIPKNSQRKITFVLVQKFCSRQELYSSHVLTLNSNTQTPFLPAHCNKVFFCYFIFKKGFICFSYHYSSLVKQGQKLKQGKTLEARVDAEAMERCLLLTDLLPCLAQPTILQNPGPSAQRWLHPQWAGPSPHQSLIKKMLYKLAFSPVLWRYFL